MKSDTLLTELLALKQSILDGKTVTAWTRLSKLIDTVEAEIRAKEQKAVKSTTAKTQTGKK